MQSRVNIVSRYIESEFAPADDACCTPPTFMLRDMSHMGRYMVTNDGGPLLVNAAYVEKARRCFALRADMKPILTNINDGDPNIHHQD